MQNFFQKRLERIQRRLGEHQAILVEHPAEVSYFTGFTGDDSRLVIGKEMTFFLTDGRYTEQISQEKQIELFILQSTPDRRHPTLLSDALRQIPASELLFSKSDMRLEIFEKFQSATPGVQWTDCAWIKQDRMVKDELEIEQIRENLIMTETAYHYIIRLVEKGKTENEIAAELEYYLRKQGAKKMSFDTIIASGPRSVLPHGCASDKAIEDNEIVLFDFGILKNGYCSDFTRCYYFGTISGSKIQEIHGIVLKALRAAEKAVKPGVRAKDVHEAAYRVISDAGYADAFTHSTGHGVGLEIHEAPSISFADDTVLREGMVFTIEPGIYIPGVGGIRLEDMVVVRRNGVEVLTSSGYDL